MVDIPMLPMPSGGSVSPQLLAPCHYEAFHTALSHLLSTDIARETVAQLMDGLPLYSTVLDTRGAVNLRGAPIQRHQELCPGSYELADDFVRSFDANSLQFPASVCYSPPHYPCHVANNPTDPASLPTY